MNKFISLYSVLSVDWNAQKELKAIGLRAEGISDFPMQVGGNNSTPSEAISERTSALGLIIKLSEARRRFPITARAFHSSQ